MKPIEVTSDYYAEYNKDSNEKEIHLKVGLCHNIEIQKRFR